MLGLFRMVDGGKVNTLADLGNAGADVGACGEITGADDTSIFDKGLFKAEAMIIILLLINLYFS